MTRRVTASGRYKVTGTMFTQGCSLADVPDGEYTHNKTRLNHAFRVYNIEKAKWYIMVTKSAADKAQWMSAFQREEEHTAANVRNGMNLVEMSSTEIGAMHGGKRPIHKKKKKPPVAHVQRKVSVAPPPGTDMRIITPRSAP